MMPFTVIHPRQTIRSIASASALWLLMLSPLAAANNTNGIFVPINHSTLIDLAAPASEVLIADPTIVDVHVHNSTHISIIAKTRGNTNIRIMNKDGTLQREMDVTIGYDLPAIRKALKDFLPDEQIGVEMVNNSIALTGQVSNTAAVDKALKIAGEFVPGSTGKTAVSSPVPGQQAPASPQTANSADAANPLTILNFLKVTSGQQVILRVRVGEINRTALKALGVDLSAGVSDGFYFATGAAGLSGILQPTTTPGNTAVKYGAGHFQFPTDSNGVPTNTQGLIGGSVTRSKFTLGGALQALEQDGLFKLLAEPNLVAISGEQAEFLAGGEIPIPVPQGGGGNGTTITIQYKPYGVAVRFKPSVLTQNLIHMEVQPEVSELDPANAIVVDTFHIPALTTRRAKTTVELAPGEGFMIAGLLKDKTSATIDQLPGAMDLPILGALFRSTQFQRNETELVIAVTPYIVDPLKNSEVKMPTDEFRPASQMEMFFYGALGSLAGKSPTKPQNQSLEGPTGFMVD